MSLAEEQLKKAPKQHRKKIQAGAQTTKSTPHPQPEAAAPRAPRIQSSDYRAWDRFVSETVKPANTAEDNDDENDDEVIDAPSLAVTADKTVVNAPNPATLPSSTRIAIDKALEALPQPTIIAMADHENRKGNDALRAHDHDDAVLFYSRSIELLPRAHVYANRALAHLKLKRFSDVVCDAANAIRLDSNCWKAYWRRAEAHKKCGRLREAIADMHQVLNIDGGNQEAARVLKDYEGLLEKSDGELAVNPMMSLPAAKTRMQIIETDAANDEDDCANIGDGNESDSEVSSDEEDQPIAVVRS
jgi:hypothetical protein